ncbi:N-acetylmuramoyl-L-alanine amidase family protein, partial [Clostridium chromiireducens]|nr:N-acetylmuramoyl-L-alanine amidase family protein [Clostridium chromiireducens]
ASGAMKTGWVKDGANWYFLNASGAMATGWVQDGGNWYFLNASGAMLSNTTVNGYKLGASGAWVK